MKGYRRVAIVEEFYYILKQIHDKDCLHMHAGSRKTYARVSCISLLLECRIHVYAKLSHVCVMCVSLLIHCRSSHYTPTYQELWFKCM